MGNVIAEGNDEEGIITGSIELSEVKEIRDMIHMFGIANRKATVSLPPERGDTGWIRISLS